MKIAKFEYTDAKNKVTQRTVAVLKDPIALLMGIDVGELSEAELQEFATLHNELHDRYMSALAGLQADFDLTHNLRQFKPTGMANVEITYV